VIQYGVSQWWKINFASILEQYGMSKDAGVILRQG